MPKITANSQSRQRPVSCRLCRLRKLRCSREAPCSNCRSRGVPCELEPYALPVSSSSVTISTASEPDLAERIRKLERIVEQQHLQLLSNSTRSLSVETQQTQQVPLRQPSVDQDRVIESSYTSLVTHAQQISQPTLLPEIEHLDKDVAWLESIYSGHDFSDKIATNKVVFRSCPIQCIASAQPYVIENTVSSSTRFEPTRCVWLPQYAEAKIMLEKYVEDVDHVHHVVHTPSLRTVLDEVYTCLSQQGQVKPGNIILLLAIFASCTHSWVPEDSKRGCLFDTSTDANDQSPLWIKSFEDVLDIAQRSTTVSIEGIQGIVITFFVLVNYEGFSRRCRALCNTALLLARDLGLHCIDHPANAALANTVEAEMGRRVWWYIVASDWSVSMVSELPHISQQELDSRIPRCMSARFDGIFRGVYQCHPRQMATKKPLNINDEDLVNGLNRVEQPLSQPTSMSYSLQRIRLAEISRTIVDRTPLMGYGPSYEVTMDVDTELQSLLHDYIPPFFSMSISTIVETYGLDSTRAAHIAQQGYMARSLLYTQRCKLHFPFYSRGFTDPTYALSRDICLQSARLIIQTESQREYTGLKYTLRYKFVGLLVSVFMASLVLLMDLCHNKSSSCREIERGELVDALGILEEARHESNVAAKFLDSLMLVLKKHKVSASVQQDKKRSKVPGADGWRAYTDNMTSIQPVSNLATPSISTTAPSANTLVSNEGDSMDDLAGGTFTNGENLSSYFNDLAQSFEQGIDVGNFDWDSILSEFSSSFA